MLPSEAIKELRELYFRKTGKEINSQEALDLGIKLVTLVRSVYKPIPNKNNHENKPKQNNRG